MVRNRRALLIAALALVGAAAVAFQVTPEGPMPLDAGRAPDTAGQGRLADRPEQIDLELLRAERAEPKDSVRNPFRFKPKAAPPPPAAVTSSPPALSPAVTVAPEDLPPPRIPLKFIGLISSRDASVGRVAVLTDGRGVYHGREGEIVEGRYRILKIGVESVELAYLDGRGRQTIRQTGQ